MTKGKGEVLLTRAWHTPAAWIGRVELLTTCQGDVFSPLGDPRENLLAITAVHPVRESAVQAILARAGASMTVANELVSSGALRQVSHGGETFYIRRLHRE